MSFLLRALIPVWMVAAAALPQPAENVRERYRQGVQHAVAGRFDEAIEAWYGLLANKQNGLAMVAKVKLARSIAIAHYKAGRLDKAVMWIEIAHKRASGDPRVIKARTVILAAKEKASAAPTPPPPPVEKLPTAAECKAAFLKGEEDFREASALVEAAADAPGIEKALTAAIAQMEIAVKGDYRKAKALYYLGTAHMLRNDDDRKDLAAARSNLEASLALDSDKATLVNLGMTCGLQLDSDKQIEYLEKALELEPNHAETHFRAAMAYDKSGRKDAARKTFEHAKAAIRVNGEYKKKFQGALKNSEVASQIAEMVGTIINESEQETLTDERTEYWAKKFQDMLGSDTKIEDIKAKIKKDGVKGFVESPEGKKLLATEEGRKIQERVLKGK